MSAPCAVCRNPEPAWMFFAKGVPDDERFQVWRCEACGFGWTDPAPADDEIGKYYPQVYYGKGNVRFHWTLEILVRLFRRRRAEQIRSRTRPGRVLDVGCGRGLILGTLKEMGYEPHGVEISEHAAWHAVHRMGAQVHVGDFLAAPYPAGGFEAVVFWHSLEHLRKPLEALRRAHEILKPGGLLVVAVPNFDSLQARLSGRNWFHLDVPRHYFHFGTQALNKALIDTGFRIADTAHFSFEQNPYGWLQSLLNTLGFEFNFLYSVIKNPTSRIVPLRKHPIQAVLTFLLLPWLTALALMLTLVEAAAGLGGTIEVYAVKK